MIDLADPLTLAALVAAWVATFGAGYLVGRGRTRTRLDRAASKVLSDLVADQTADDRDALGSLPPGLLAGDVWRHAAIRGISIREAAEDLFIAQARARLSANVRRHHGRPSR